MNPNLNKVLLFTPLLLSRQCDFPPPYISHTLGMEYGTVNVKYCRKKKKFLDSKAWSFSLVPSGTLDKEEKEKQEKASVGMEGK